MEDYAPQCCLDGCPEPLGNSVSFYFCSPEHQKFWFERNSSDEMDRRKTLGGIPESLDPGLIEETDAATLRVRVAGRGWVDLEDLRTEYAS